MSHIIFLTTSVKPYSLLHSRNLITKRAFSYGLQLRTSKVNPLAELQVRHETKTIGNESRQKGLKDLVVTIEQLHKAKLSESSGKKLESRPDSGSLPHTKNITNGQPEPVSRVSSWASSVESFSSQLSKWSPKVSLPKGPKENPVEVGSLKTSNVLPSPKSKTAISSAKAAASKNRPLAQKQKSANAQRKPKTVENNSKILARHFPRTDDAVLYPVTATDDFDFDPASSLDVITDQDIIMLNSKTPLVSVGPEDYNILEEDLDRDLHYDVVGDGFPQMDAVTTTSTTQPKAKKKTLKAELVHQNLDNAESDDAKDIVNRLSNVLKLSKKSMIEVATEKGMQIKESMYLAEVSSYIDLCINTNMLKNAQSLLTTGFFRGQNAKALRGIRPVRDLAVYTKLMRAWAKQGNLEAIRKLFLQLDGLQLKPSFESYAVCLECLGRQNSPSRDVIDSVIEDIKSAGFQLENIFIESTFLEEDKHFILKAIKMVQPGFSPNERVSPTDYVCSLLLDLNANKQPMTNPFHGVVSNDELMKQAVKQIEIEMSGQVVVDSIESCPELNATVLAARLHLGEQKEKWRAAMKHAFLTSRQHLQAYKESGMSLVPYLKLWNADVYVDLMMQEIDMIGQHLVQYSPSCSVINLNLGDKIFRKFVVQSRIRSKYIEKFKSVYEAYAQKFNEEEISQNHRQMWMEIMAKKKLDNFMENDIEKWPFSVTKALGKFLYNIIMSEVKIDASPRKLDETANVEPRHKTEIPAFFTVFRTRDGNQIEEIMPHPFLVRLYSDAKVTQLTFEPHELPSLVPPVPWFEVDSGGNLLSTTDLIRNRQFSQLQYKAVENLPPQSLYPMFDGLNAVSACPWRANKKVLDVVIEVFNKGGDMKLGIPEKVDVNAELPKITMEMSVEQRVQLIQNNRKIVKERKEMYSQWCTELYRLSIAQKYRDEVFWYPHSMDFRGRIYPTPPHFNHLGNDIGRSIMLFGKGKPLGPDGLNWLKIHLINLTGFKKRRPNRERLEYADEVMPDILDSADNPLTGRLWWQKADEPWQTLACCVEIANAVRSPDPEKFISHIPIHQDGSCNGLQHYAALGRDESGANSVNLNPFDAPQDVYSDVVELVEAQRLKDAAAGDQIAKRLEGFVQRKVIKQTIMTTVYGVTRYGARLQIGGQLRHLDEFPQDLVVPSSIYLTNKTFESLQTMFTSTKEIQDWFVLAADIISRLRHQPVEWATPLGWPVIQPYFKSHRISDKKLGTAFYEKPVPYKQKNAFPPNFIHSLDSAHMMLTAIYCLRSGILFASVHDCFWTHACDVQKMNKVCREQFVGLHSEPILEDLAKYFVDKFGYSPKLLLSEKKEKQQAMNYVNQVLQKVPDRGNFDIKKVMESTYFFS